MYQTLIVVHVLFGFSIIGMVLLQQGRGADAGAGFGGGASSSLFGARGSASFLSRTTGILAALFFSSSLLLAYLGDKHDNKPHDIMEAPLVEQAPSDLPSVSQEASEPAKADSKDQPAAPAEKN